MTGGPRILISTGELSGDYHASNLVKEIKKKCPGAEILGIGSHNLEAAGVELLYDSSDWGAIGIWQNAKKVRNLSKLKDEIVNRIPNLNLDLIIVVDFRVFHASLLNGIRNLDIGKLYYIAPIVWPGFRTIGIGKAYSDLLEKVKQRDVKNRFEALTELADKLILAYPFSLDEYIKAGADVEFLGHPLMNNVNRKKTDEQVRKELGIDDDTKLLGIFPGSRTHELRHHLPIIKKVIEELKSRIPNLYLYMPLAHEEFRQVVDDLLGDQVRGINFVDSNDHDIFGASDVVLSKTGTSVQVLMALGVPTVAFYTVVSRLWYNVSIRFLANFDFIAFPNVLAGRKVIPEFIQNTFTAESIIDATMELLENDEKRERMSSELLELRDQLYRVDAVERAADIALEIAGRHQK